MEATYVCSAMPCVPDCWGVVWHHYLQTNPIGTFISLSGLAHPSDLRLDKGCKTLLSLSLHCGDISGLSNCDYNQYRQKAGVVHIMCPCILPAWVSDQMPDPDFMS